MNAKYWRMAWRNTWNTLGKHSTWNQYTTLSVPALWYSTEHRFCKVKYTSTNVLMVSVVCLWFLAVYDRSKVLPGCLHYCTQSLLFSVYFIDNTKPSHFACTAQKPEWWKNESESFHRGNACTVRIPWDLHKCRVLTEARAQKSCDGLQYIGAAIQQQEYSKLSLCIRILHSSWCLPAWSSLFTDSWSYMFPFSSVLDDHHLKPIQCYSAAGLLERCNDRWWSLTLQGGLRRLFNQFTGISLRSFICWRDSCRDFLWLSTAEQIQQQQPMIEHLAKHLNPTNGQDTQLPWI